MKSVKIYTLVCVNEECEVVYCETFNSKELAVKAMTDQYESELECTIEDEDEDPEDYGCEIGDNFAVIGWGVLESTYKWSIHEQDFVPHE